MPIPFDLRIERLLGQLKAAIEKGDNARGTRIEVELDAAFDEFTEFHKGTKALLRDFARLAPRVLSPGVVRDIQEKCLRSSTEMKKRRAKFNKLREFRRGSSR